MELELPIIEPHTMNKVKIISVSLYPRREWEPILPYLDHVLPNRATYLRCPITKSDHMRACLHERHKAMAFENP